MTRNETGSNMKAMANARNGAAPKASRLKRRRAGRAPGAPRTMVCAGAGIPSPGPSAAGLGAGGRRKRRDRLPHFGQPVLGDERLGGRELVARREDGTGDIGKFRRERGRDRASRLQVLEAGGVAVPGPPADLAG